MTLNSKLLLILFTMFIICNTISKCSFLSDANALLDILIGDKNITNNSKLTTSPSLLPCIFFIFSNFIL